MRLLLFNLVTDESNPVLGFACAWIRELAARCEYIDVITMYRGVYQLPPKVRVYSAGREQGLGKPLRLARFYRHLLRLLASRRYDACFAHMMPLFAGLAGPLLSARGIPTTLWYAHRQRSAQLRLGMAMSRRVVSTDASSYPYVTGKLRVIGQGMDTDLYRPAAALAEADSARPLVVQVARLAQIKHQATAMEAVAATDARLALIGGTQPAAPRQYEQDLRKLAQRLALDERCHFAGDQTLEQVLGWYARATVAVNLSPPGLFDKAALESMACALPTVVCNPAFAPLLGAHRQLLLTAGPEDVAGLRERLEQLFALSAAERAQIGSSLRENVMRAHGLKQLIERLLAVLETGELPDT